eukprot:m.217214 g.217214  ORF g.217214 m.217214 type:complete len:101 (+) comp54106_c0_seq1:734-1036(+)
MSLDFFLRHFFFSQWLAKQSAARQAVQEAKSANPGEVERDPLWYKDRGNEFFSSGNIPAAINAFTAASMDSPFSVCYLVVCLQEVQGSFLSFERSFESCS